MPLIIVVAGIALLLLLTIKIKLNTFVSLIIGKRKLTAVCSHQTRIGN
ncbi:GntT/GntP/DsdX family permease, partial [Escherichia coli]